jgi:hypothetical protein
LHLDSFVHIFTAYSSSDPLSPTLPHLLLEPAFPQGRTCSALPFSKKKVKREKENKKTF